jgi:hypothetical protein
MKSCLYRGGAMHQCGCECDPTALNSTIDAQAKRIKELEKKMAAEKCCHGLFPCEAALAYDDARQQIEELLAEITELQKRNKKLETKLLAHEIARNRT